VQHLADGSFEEVDGSEVQIGNPLQVEVNEKGKARTCQDSRFVNAYIADYSFTQETLSKHVAMILERDMQMITTDVEKAYYQVPLHKRSQPYLAWRHRGRWIKPTIIVFGIKPAPFVFTKMMRVLLVFVRLLNIRGSNCIDDNIWADMTMDDVVVLIKLVFGEIGWTFNSKCVFKPSTTALYNGMWLDTKRFEVRAVDEKIDAARRVAWTIWYAARDGEQVNVRDLQRLTGRLQSMKLAIEGVAVWTRGIYADIARAQEEGGGVSLPSWAKTHLREAAMRDVWFWAMRLGRSQFNGLPIHEFGAAIHLTMNTDASDVGWGAHSGDDGGWKIGGELPEEVLKHSSTAREIKGLQLAAAQRADSMKGKNVRICMDSYPAIRNLINGGGPVEFLNELVREWWEWTKKHRVRPTYQWIPREENSEADRLSKMAAETLKITPRALEEVRDWLEKEGHPSWHCVEWLRTRVQAPVFDHIAVRVGEMISARRPVCIVVPTWRGHPWWSRLERASAARLPLGRVENVIQGHKEYAGHNWMMEAHVFIPELKEDKPAKRKR
jgi:ribonuclease HI